MKDGFFPTSVTSSFPMNFYVLLILKRGKLCDIAFFFFSLSGSILAQINKHLAISVVLMQTKLYREKIK